jgi:hypothetical protein
MVRTVYNLIEQVIPYLKLDVIDLFFAKVAQTKTFDEKFLLFLKEFSTYAFQKQYQSLELQWKGSQVAAEED